MEPSDGSGDGHVAPSENHVRIQNKEKNSVRHLSAFGRGGGLSANETQALYSGRRVECELRTKQVDELIDTQIDSRAEEGRKTILDENESKEYGKGEEGKQGSKKLLEEYRELLRTIHAYKLLVEQRKSDLRDATNDRDRKFLTGTLASAERHLREYRNQERNHFYSGTESPEEAWGDMSSDETSKDDEDEDEEVEMVTPEEHRKRSFYAKLLVDKEVDIEAFEETAGDEDMREGGQGYYGEKTKKSDEDEKQGGDPNVEDDEQGEWETVTNKKQLSKRKEGVEKNNSAEMNNVTMEGKHYEQQDNRVKQYAENKSVMNNNDTKTSNRTKPTNPYVRNTAELSKQRVRIQEQSSMKEIQQTDKQQMEEERKSSLQRKITSYATATKVGKNANQIRFNFSFKVRINSASEWRRVAKTILEQSYEVDRKSFILPWDENRVEGGQGITLEMVTNKLTMRDSDIAKYFNSNGNMIPGKVYYQAGVQISTDLEKDVFVDKWNNNKRDRKERGLDALNIGLANMQNSAESFLIGIAVGSSEDQDALILNKELERVTGIKGIEVSYQNFFQAGITNEFWDNANNKAKATGAKETSRDFLRCKYGWAPNALAVYVPAIHMVASARKIMIDMYGKLIDGVNPQWPDGTRMRFLPIKGSSFRSEKTKTIIKKRIAYHIWTKAHEKVINTNLVNIHEGQEIFEGLSFSQVLLNMKSSTVPNSTLFRHFKRMWSNGKSNTTRWSISVHKGLYTEAVVKLQEIQQELVDQYGDRVNYFFFDTPSVNRSTQRNMTEEDDTSWVEEDDPIPDKEVIAEGFENFLDDDNKSEVSWGTSNTKYTEMVNPSTYSTSASSITQEMSQVSNEEIDNRHRLIERQLVTRFMMDKDSVAQVLKHNAPYRIVIRAIKDRVWDIEEILEGLNAIYQVQKIVKAPDPSNNTRL